MVALTIQDFAVDDLVTVQVSQDQTLAMQLYTTFTRQVMCPAVL